MTLLQQLFPLMEKIHFISFDIFDTLLVRPYMRPVDLFEHLEKAYNRKGFADERRDAERRAHIRHKELEDITFDMIYDEIDDEFKDMKQKEMDWEEMVLRANPELKQVYDYALAQGKKIIITSDMYLPSVFLAKVLRQNGFDGWEKIYVSGDVGKTKYKGTLYQQILQDFTLQPSDILHIGDNKKSDFLIPEKSGIKAIKYCAYYSQFLHQHPSLKKYKNTCSLGMSIWQALFALHFLSAKVGKKQTYWFDLGYTYAGPIIYAYTRHIEKTAVKHHLDTLFFIARDGYLLQKVFSIINQNIPTQYIYAPRILNNLLRLDYVQKKIGESLSIIQHYAQKDEEISALYRTSKPQNWRQAHQFIQDNIGLFRRLAKNEMKIYRSCIQKNIKNTQNIGLVDTITGAFSSQKLIESALGKNVHGIYWGICDQRFAPMFEHSVFVGETQGQSEEYTKIFTRNWNFMEFLMTSPEHPIINLSEDGKPIYAKEQNPYEIKRSHVYEEIAEGAISFAQTITQLFGGKDIYLTAGDAVNLANSYIQNPRREDIIEMFKIKCAEDAGHQTFIPLFSANVGMLDFIMHPKKTLRTLKKCIWHTPLQSFILCLCKPLAFRMRGIKKFRIALFPYLKRQYMAVSFGWGENVNYKFIIGNVKG